MDWAKAKSMIIYIFIILNAFLFANIVFLLSYYDISEEVIDSTKKILKACNVKLECKIPKNTPRVSTYTFDDMCTKNLINSKSDSNLNIKIISDNEFEIKYNKVPSYFYKSDKKSIKEHLIKVAKGFKMDIDDCHFDYVNNENGEINGSFFMVKENVIFFDNKIKYNIVNGKLKLKFVYFCYKNLNNTNMNAMPVYQILVKNFVKDKKVTINSIDFGIITSKIDDITENSGEYPLAIWRIHMNKSKRYFSALDGAEVFNEE